MPHTRSRQLLGISPVASRSAAISRGAHRWPRLQHQPGCGFFALASSRAPRIPFAGSTTRNPPHVTGPTLFLVLIVFIQASALVLVYVWFRKQRAHHKRTVMMLRAVPDLMFVQSRDGKYLDYHASDRSRLLLSPDFFLNKYMRDLLPREVLEIVEPLFDRVWTTDQPVAAEYSLDMEGGRRFYELRLFRYDRDQVLSLVRDVTDRTRTEAALRATERRYTLATAAARAGVWEWNLESGEMYIDPQLKALLGFFDHEIANRKDDWWQRVYPEDLPTISAQAQACIDGDTPTFEVEHRMVHKDGSLRWFMSRASVVPDERGRQRLVGTDTDITAQRHADEALHRLQLELERMSRAATLGEFGAAIAHEVRQPLAAIVMDAGTCLRVLSTPSPDLEMLRVALEEIVVAGKTADAIIRRERGLFTRQTLEKLPIDVNGIIRQVLGLSAVRLRAARVRMETRLTPALPCVVGDRLALSQVLLNLVANAVDAMAAVDPDTRLLTISSTLNGDGLVQVSVRDKGVGLEAVDVAQMFMAAYTTKPEGTGIGLSITRSLIEEHGGRLWADRNEGGGATFSFVLPVQADDAHVH
jgi:PAS domain S-box-containing protein